MSDALLSLTIEPQFLSATVTERSDHIIEVVQCSSITRSSSLSDDLKQLFKTIDGSVKKVAIAVGSDNLCFYKLLFPFADKKKILQIITPELEEQTALDLDDYFFDYTISKHTDGSSDVLVALIKKEELLNIINTLQEHQIDPDYISVAGLNIPTLHIFEADETFETLFTVHLIGKKVIFSLWNYDTLVFTRQTYLTYNDLSLSQEKQLIKVIKQTLLSLHQHISGNFKITLSGDLTNSFSKSLKPELKHPITICKTSERSFVKIDPNLHGSYNDTLMGESLAQAKLITRKKKLYFNFRTGSLAKKKHSWHQSRITHLALTLCTLLSIVSICWAWVDHKKLTAQKKVLQNEIHQIFVETLPAVSKVVNPTQQLRVALNQISDDENRLSTSPLDFKILELLAQLSTSIPPQTDVTLTKLIAEQQQIRLKGQTTDFNGVDKVQKHLQNAKYFSNVSINSANLNSQKSQVSFELKLTILNRNE